LKIIYCSKEHPTPMGAALASGIEGERLRLGMTNESVPRENEEQIAEIKVSRYSLSLPLFRKREDDCH